jgi:hypothetical protein
MARRLPILGKEKTMLKQRNINHAENCDCVDCDCDRIHATTTGAKYGPCVPYVSKQTFAIKAQGLSDADKARLVAYRAAEVDAARLAGSPAIGQDRPVNFDERHFSEILAEISTQAGI